MKYCLIYLLCFCLTPHSFLRGQELPDFSLVRTVVRDDMVSREVLLFPPQEQHVHGSSLLALPNGDLLVAWFQGSGERRADDVRIMGARRVAGAERWSAPFELADTPGMPDCNPVLFLNEQGRLFLIWIAVLANRWESSLLRVRTTEDYEGPGPPNWTWQDNILLKPDDRFAEEVERKFEDLPPNPAGWAEYARPYDEMIIEASRDPRKRSIGWMTRIKPLILDSGRILLPLYSDGFNFSLIAISDDAGASWRPSLPIVGRGPIQPALAQRKDGTVVAFLRDAGDAPSRLQVSYSKDGGESWTPARKTNLPSTASVDLLRLEDDHWALLVNDVADGRYHLALYLSEDEGRTWTRKLPIEEDASREGRFSYPAMVQTPDGHLHITYSHHPGEGQKTIKYVRIK